MSTAQLEDTPSVHNEVFLRLVLRAHVQQLWAKFTVLAFWSWLWWSLIGYAREVVGRQAGRSLRCWIEAGKVIVEKQGDAEQRTRYRKGEGIWKPAETRPAVGHSSKGEVSVTKSARKFWARERAEAPARNHSYCRSSERCSLRRCTGAGRGPSGSAKTDRGSRQLSEWGSHIDRGKHQTDRKGDGRKVGRGGKGRGGIYAMGKAVGVRLARSGVVRWVDEEESRLLTSTWTTGQWRCCILRRKIPSKCGHLAYCSERKRNIYC